MPPLARAVRRFSAVCAVLALAATVPAEVVLTLDAVPGNVGETVELGLRLAAAGGSVPTTMVLFITYDAARVAPAVDFYGAGRGPARATPALTAAGKQVDAEVFPQGVVSLAVLGTGATAIPSGLVINLAFEILSGSPEGISVAIDGREANEPVQINGVDSFSTAANASSQSLPLRFNDGAVIVGCTPRAGAPSGVAATTGRADGVLVTWSGVANPGATYRVFRGVINDFSAAQPLGVGETAQTNFLDTTAAAPELPEGAGCACPGPEPVVTTYFYWVVARTEAGCTGNPGGPAQGARGGAKTTPAAGEAQSDVLPGRVAGADIREVAPGDPVAVRLPAPLAAADAEIPELARGAYRLERVRRDDGSLWIRAVPASEWPAGRVFHLRAWGRDADGRRVGPVAHAFRAGDRPELARGARVEPVEAGAYPYLEVGVNAVWRLGPETVYDAPRAFLVPVPSDEDPRALLAYRYLDGGAAAGWYPAARVRGWLAGEPTLHREGGRVYLRLEVWEGGVVQLGTRDTPRPEARAAALPALRGDLVVGLLAALAVCAAARRGRARGCARG